MHSDLYSEVIYEFNIESMVKYFNDIVDLKNKYVEICEKKSLTVDEKEICQSLIRQIDDEF